MGSVCLCVCGNHIHLYSLRSYYCIVGNYYVYAINFSSPESHYMQCIYTLYETNHLK